MPSVSIKWGIMDDGACPICKAINGYTWTFETGKDVFPNELVHPQYGEVWNISEGSKAHEHHGTGLGGFPASCRCHVTPEFNLSDLLVKIKRLRDEVKAEYGAETP